MNFIKWPSITNTYNTRFINKFLEEYPELADETYVITEKLHGSSLQFGFYPDEPMVVGSRTRWLKEGESFFGVWDVLKNYDEVLGAIQDEVKEENTNLRLFAELFGRGVQKEIQYSGDKGIRLFGMMVDDLLVPYSQLYDFVEYLFYPTWRNKILVPQLAIIDTLREALAFDVGFPTILNPVDGNLCEGIVIQPVDRVYRNHLGQSFLLKKKNAKFMEKQRAKKELKQEPDEVIRLNTLFRTYVTEQRLDTLFSKAGEIEMVEQLGDYIKWYIEDAKKDFIEDYAEELSGLEAGQERKVYNVGSTIANMLKKRLNEEI